MMNHHPHAHSHLHHPHTHPHPHPYPHPHSHLHAAPPGLPGLGQQQQHSLSADNVSWSTPSGTPSPPPPPPLPPHTSARWARSAPTAQGDGCHQCRGRYATLSRQGGNGNCYTGNTCNKDQPPYIVYPTAVPNNDRCPTPLSTSADISPGQGLGAGDGDDDSTCPVLLAGELRSLHRNVPALRRRDVDTAAIRQHHYPEGGWGWIVCGAAFLAHLLTTGLQLAFGLLYLYTMQHLVPRNVDREAYAMGTAWLGALCLCVSFFSAPVVIAVCRRKSTRLAAVFGGLVMALGCLFTSFAVQFHQAVLSYGIVLGIGCGLVRETSGLVLGHYFKRRREFVEMVAQAGSGVGVALFSVLYKEAVGKLGWRLGLQAVTGLLALGFFLGVVYRSAALYHPQRRAITHLKNQRKKVKEKKAHGKARKPPLFDLSPLRSRALRVLMMACSTAALGLYTPVFYLAIQGYKEGLEDSALVLLQTFLGFALALGCVGFGLVTVRPSTQCLISRQYLCQAAMAGIGISLLALSAVQGYHGYVLFVWLYGVCLGGFSYSLKMLTLERLRARHFTRAWGWVRGAEALPVLLGVPITGYINQAHPRAGYYFSFAATVLGAALFFLVGQPKKQHADAANGHLPAPAPPPAECACPVGASPYLNPYGLYRQGSHQYERVFFNYNDWERGSLHRHSLRARPDPTPPFLPKSVSYAANMDRHAAVRCITRDADFLKYSPHFRPPAPRHTLRPSKSVPEGLARWDYTWGSCRRPHRRPVQVIEQITTSV